MTHIRVLLRERHQIAGSGLDDFRLTSPLDALNRTLEQVSRPFDKYILIASIIALLIGGLVVMNIMTISVSERTREIGIRRSMGAKRRDITMQFLIEAMIITATGGLIGATLSVGGSHLLAMMSDIPPLLSWPAIGLSLASSILVGVFFGIHPARKAAMIDPILALRDGA
jgi:putative ABC transport system permease protein